MALFESYDRRIGQIQPVMDKYGIKDFDDARNICKEKGYTVESISATIMAEKPKLLSFIPEITKSLATALNIDSSLVGIGATTLEGLGFVGREEGICTHATATLVKI